MLQYSENQSSGTLRLDLQGLRAIAVTVVFFAHAGVQGFSGGYIGVDLFFVLSGFLITGVLYKEFEATGSANIFAFYSRRIKRLLPAMALVIGLTLAISFVLLPGFQAKAQIGSSPFASLWLSNFYFTFSELDYFNELGEKDLFLHTWSLAVEEQFYLVWPFLLLFLARFRQRRVSEKYNLRIRLAVGLLLVLGLSFALSLYWIEESPLLAFYQMPSRAWQFALGALVYLAVYRTPFRTSESWGTAKGLSLLIVGAGAIAASTWFYDGQMMYPGWAAVVPSVGAALVILAGFWVPHYRNPLAIAPLVWLGNRSYSLYLWHWPVLLLFEAEYGALTAELIIVVGVLSLLLTEVTYRFVERPFWKGALSNFGPKKTVQFGAVVMLLALLGSFHAARQPLVAEVARGADISQQWRSDYPIIYKMPCDAWFSHDKVQPCVFGPSDAEKTAMLLGDSIGVQWFSLVGMPYLENDWRFIVLTKSSCPMVDQPYFYDRIKQIFSVCDQWRDKVLDRLAEWEPEVVVVGSASTYDFSDKEWVSGSQRVWEKIAQTGARVVVLPGTPTLEMDAPSCISKEMQNGGRDIVKACRSDQSDDAAYRVSSLLKHAAAGMPAVDVLDLNSWVCPSGICSAVTSDGVVVFRDSQHLTDSFVYSIAPQITPQLKAFSTDDSSQSL